jgi:hypothetical protein
MDNAIIEEIKKGRLNEKEDQYNDSKNNKSINCNKIKCQMKSH